MSYTIQLLHIIINTKDRKKTIPIKAKDNLYRYIRAIINDKNCELHRINGVENHIHILVGLHPSIALMELVRDIKRGTSLWLKQSADYPHFDGWSKEYAAFSVSWSNKDKVTEYIQNQEEHHKRLTFAEEWNRFLQACEMSEYRSK